MFAAVHGSVEKKQQPECSGRTRAYLTILDTALDLCAVLDDVFDF
jgi:hypothetical protein